MKNLFLIFTAACLIFTAASCNTSGESKSGQIDSAFGITGDQTAATLAMASDSSGSLYIGASAYIGSVEYDWMLKKYDSVGTEITTGWDKVIDGVIGEEHNDFLFDMAVDSDGNLFAVGKKGMDVADLAWYKKFSPDGTEDTVNWDKTPGFNGFGSEARSVEISSDNHVWIAGNYYSTSGNSDWYIQEYLNDSTTTGCTAIYYNDNGTSDNDTDILKNMHIDSSNRVYAVGYSRVDNVSDYKAVIRVYSDEGTDLWNDSFGEGTSKEYMAIDIKTDSNGNVYVLGQADNIVTGSSKGDIWVKKYSNSGTEITDGWDKKIDYNYGEQYAMCLEVESNDTVYVCYVTNNTSDSVWHINTFAADGTSTDTGWNRIIENESEITLTFGLYMDKYYGYIYGSLMNGSLTDWIVNRYYR